MKQVLIKPKRIPGTREMEQLIRHAGDLVQHGLVSIRRAVDGLRAMMWSFYDDAGGPDDLRRL